MESYYLQFIIESKRDKLTKVAEKANNDHIRKQKPIS